MNSDPILRFRELLAQAAQLGIVPYNAAAFATTGKDLQPTVRMLLLKDVDDRGLVFYTNLESRKGRQMNGNPRASACFWWPQLRQQVRFEGAVELVSERQSDEYFASRPPGSQIGAWASRQSSELSSREELIAAAESFAAKFNDLTVPRPPYWSGFRLLAERIEFWREQPDRLHDRELYTRQADGWVIRLLAP
ncbi:MAG: Pyridoxamine 5-phosphate oxidase [Deltaproteobacteria bacterium]|nr:Pyridoxamine 5-phosphate oxidase [Deltaproteobacteria bacterium]